MGAGAIQLQCRRGTAAVMNSFVGAPGELCVDLTSMRTVIHDGETMGGWPQERANLNIVSDINYTVLPTDVIVMFNKLTAGRTATLPSVTNYPPGQKLTIVDGSGSANTSNITVQTASTIDKLPGGSTSFAIATSYGHLSLMAGKAVAAAGSINAVTAQWIRI